MRKKLKRLKYYLYLKAGFSLVVLLNYYLVIRNLGTQFDIKLSSSIFENLVIFYLVYELIRFFFQVLDIKNRKLLKFVVAIAFINVTVIAIIDVTTKFQIDIGKEYNLIIVFKALSLIPISIIVYLLTTNLAKRVPDKLSFVRDFLIRYHLLINLIVIILGFLWIVNIIQLSERLLIGLSMFVIIVLFFIFSIFYTNELVKPVIERYEEYFLNFRKRLFTVLTIVFGIFSYFILKDYLQLDHILNYLKEFYIVKTDILKISVYSVLESLIFFTFILNLILITKSLIRFYEYKRTGEFKPTPIEAVIYNFGVLFAAIISLSVLGITWKVLLPLIGALGIGAGFGLQSIVNNYISGFIIIFNRKVKIGDVLEIPGSAGKFVGNENDVIFGIVTEIGVINTVVETIDGVEVAIPNSKFVSGDIINYTYSHNKVRMRIPFKVGYDVDNKKVEEVLLKVTEEFKGLILPFPKPQVWFFEMKDYYNLYYLLFWINARHWRQIRLLRSNIYKRVWEEFEKEGIKVPVINIEIKDSMPEPLRKKLNL
ncbi:mechanosensitive ion channel family protein [Persephonella sp.]